MLSTPVADPLFTLHLQPTQRAWERLPSGADITVQEGAVRLYAMAYLAGMWVELPVLLHAGEQHRVDVAGWMQIEAVGAAKVRAEVRQWRGLGWWGRWAVVRLLRGPHKIANTL